MITICNQTTRRTTMLAHREGLSDVRAARARLTCPAGVNFHEHAPGTFSLVREIKEKVGPSSVSYRFSKSASRQAFYVQILSRNQAVAINDLPRLLVVEVPTLITNVVVKSLQQQYRFTSPVRSLLSPRNAPLQSSQLSLSGPEPSRVFDLFAGAKSCEESQADINADRRWTKEQRLRVTLDAEQSKPATGFPLDGQRFNLPCERSVKFDAKEPELRQPQSVSVQCVSYVPKCDAAIAVSRAVSRVARCVALLDSSKERLESQTNAFQCVFERLKTKCGHVLTRRLDRPQLPFLIKPRDRLAVPIPCLFSFLECGIVKLATNCQMVVESIFLSLCGVKAITEGLNHASILPHRFSLTKDCLWI